jgi:hypothetical protein
MKTCPFCCEEIHHSTTFGKSYSRALPFPNSTAESVLLGITTWLTWTVPPLESETERPNRISTVSFQRLMSIISARREAKTAQTSAVHQLVRFNVYNFGEKSIALCAVALKTLDGDSLSCELVPSVVVRAGARYPLMVEVTEGPVAEAVNIEVEHIVGQRLWVEAPLLPKP